MDPRSVGKALIACAVIFCARSETCFLVGDALGKGMVTLLGSVKSSGTVTARDAGAAQVRASEVGVVTAHPDGLHGYIGFGHEKLPSGSGFVASFAA